MDQAEGTSSDAGLSQQESVQAKEESKFFKYLILYVPVYSNLQILHL